jgi:hypothetical protein
MMTVPTSVGTKLRTRPYQIALTLRILIESETIVFSFSTNDQSHQLVSPTRSFQGAGPLNQSTAAAPVPERSMLSFQRATTSAVRRAVRDQVSSLTDPNGHGPENIQLERVRIPTGYRFEDIGYTMEGAFSSSTYRCFDATNFAVGMLDRDGVPGSCADLQDLHEP